MFTLLVGCPPFWHRKQMVMLRNIMEGKYSFTSPEWADISGEHCLVVLIFVVNTNYCFAEDPKDLIRKCLVVEPENRITVKEALAHPFFHTTVSDSIVTLFVCKFKCSQCHFCASWLVIFFDSRLQRLFFFSINYHNSRLEHRTVHELQNS